MSETYPPDSLEAKVVEVLKDCYDPEIPVNIYDLGLIYGIQADEINREVRVTMTLTSPACPVAGSLPPHIQDRLQREVPGIETVQVEVVWDPPWSMDLMSDAVKLQLGIM